MKISHKKLLGLVTAFALAVPAVSVSALELGVFGDVSLTSSNDKEDNNHFAIGGLDLYGNEQISDNTSAFFEVVFENDGDSFVVDVERYQVNHKFSDALTLGAGRFHAPLGYWNRNFHHGVLIQDTPSRPAFLDFEDGEAAILPMHSIGLMAMGKFNNGVSYELSVGNSNSYDTSAGFGTDEIRLGNVSDLSEDKSIIGRVSYAFSDVPLHLSAFAMRNQLVEDSTAGSAGVMQGGDLAKTNVYGADLRYERGHFDALAEYYYIDNQDETSGVLGDGAVGDDGTANAFYVQLGYRFKEMWKVVYRYEDLSTDSDDTYFRVLGTEDYSAHVAVLRYDVDDSNALMLQVINKDNDISKNVTEYTLNWSFLMF